MSAAAIAQAVVLGLQALDELRRAARDLGIESDVEAEIDRWQAMRAREAELRARRAGARPLPGTDPGD